MLQHLPLLLATLLGPNLDDPSTWEDGTVLLLQDSNAVVAAVTDSRVTHVAMLFQDKTQPMVYEATPDKVRRIALAHYLQEIAVLNERRSHPMKVYALRPRLAFPEDQAKKMLKFANGEIGRRYSVKSYVRDKQADGVHCSEFASRVLNSSDRYSLKNFHRITPVRLRNLLVFSYRTPVAVDLPQRNGSNWCQRTSECWNDWWNWCGWACVETMTFCF